LARLGKHYYRNVDVWTGQTILYTLEQSTFLASPPFLSCSCSLFFCPLLSAACEINLYIQEQIHRKREQREQQTSKQKGQQLANEQRDGVQRSSETKQG